MKMLELRKLLNQALFFRNFLILIRECGRLSKTLQRRGIDL